MDPGLKGRFNNDHMAEHFGLHPLSMGVPKPLRSLLEEDAVLAAEGWRLIRSELERHERNILDTWPEWDALVTCSRSVALAMLLFHRPSAICYLTGFGSMPDKSPADLAERPADKLYLLSEEDPAIHGRAAEAYRYLLPQGRFLAVLMQAQAVLDAGARDYATLYHFIQGFHCQVQMILQAETQNGLEAALRLVDFGCESLRARRRQFELPYLELCVERMSVITGRVYPCFEERWELAIAKTDNRMARDSFERVVESLLRQGGAAESVVRTRERFHAFMVTPDTHWPVLEHLDPRVSEASLVKRVGIPLAEDVKYLRAMARTMPKEFRPRFPDASSRLARVMACDFVLAYRTPPEDLVPAFWTVELPELYKARRAIARVVRRVYLWKLSIQCGVVADGTQPMWLEGEEWGDGDDDDEGVTREPTGASALCDDVNAEACVLEEERLVQAYALASNLADWGASSCVETCNRAALYEHAVMEVHLVVRRCLMDCRVPTTEELRKHLGSVGEPWEALFQAVARVEVVVRAHIRMFTTHVYHSNGFSRFNAEGGVVSRVGGMPTVEEEKEKDRGGDHRANDGGGFVKSLTPETSAADPPSPRLGTCRMPSHRRSSCPRPVAEVVLVPLGGRTRGTTIVEEGTTRKRSRRCSNPPKIQGSTP